MLKILEAQDPDSCWNKAQGTELVFVLLGRDPAAPLAIEAWCKERIRLGKNQKGDPQIEEASFDIKRRFGIDENITSSRAIG